LNAPLQLGTIPRILTIFKRMMSNALREPAAQGTETGTGAVRGIPASPGTATGPAYRAESRGVRPRGRGGRADRTGDRAGLNTPTSACETSSR
jgi:hypothetical protein